MNGSQIIIIGGGIGGLAMALALQQKGIVANVYERASELSEVGAGISLWVNATRILENLGLLNEALQESHRFKEVLVKNTKGALMSNLSVAQYAPASIGIHRADLLNLLQRHLPQAQIFLSHELKHFTQQGDKIQAHFTNGNTVEGDLLIGADGLRSRVREQVIGDGEPIYRGYTVWRGLMNSSHKETSETMGSGYRFGIFPIGKSRVYWYATANLPVRQPDPLAGRKQQLLSIFQHWHAPIGEMIANTNETDILRNDCFDRNPTRGWSKGNAVLIGDAAHPTTPNMGQGGGMALEDTAVLTKCLLQHSSNIPHALQAFEQARFARTKNIIRMSRFIGATGQWANPFARTWRDLLYRLTPAKVADGNLRWVYTYET